MVLYILEMRPEARRLLVHRSVLNRAAQPLGRR